MPPTDRTPWKASPFAARLVLTLALLIGVALVIKLADVLLLVFGAILVAVLLRAIAEPLQTRLKLGRMPSLVIAVAVVSAMIAALTWAFGRQVEAQLASLAGLLPGAWQALKARLATSPLGGYLALPKPDGQWLSFAPRFAADAAGAVAAVVIVCFAGLYLAFHPQTYLTGSLKLFPLTVRERAAEVLAAVHAALRQWLLGQLLSMLIVGITTGVGLWLVGVPSAVGLGVIAGAGQFIPVVGPMAATIPGLILALAAGPQTFALAAAVYFGASLTEANIITPLVLRQLAQLPMAVTLFAVLGMGVLLGPLGVLFATPLAVVAYVLVRKVYVEGVLGDEA